MPSPPIQVFLTTIASQVTLRQRQEYILRILQGKGISYEPYDLASDEKAKRLWKRKAPLAKQQLPGILVGGVFPGTFDEFEEAVEYGELDTFLRLKEEWKPDGDDAVATPPATPVGVPGAYSPSQMTNQRPSFAPSPLKDKSRQGTELDAGSVLDDSRLQGVSVTDAELADLVKELGLEGEEAGDLIKGLSAPKDVGPVLGEGKWDDTQEKDPAEPQPNAAAKTNKLTDVAGEDERGGDGISKKSPLTVQRDTPDADETTERVTLEEERKLKD